MKAWLAVGLTLLATRGARAQVASPLHVAPPDRSTIAAGQRFDVRVEIDPAADGAAPAGPLRVFVDDREITAQNEAAAGSGAFVKRGLTLDTVGPHLVRAEAGPARAESRLTVDAWKGRTPGLPYARNVILLLGDGMGAAHRGAARIASRGVADGKVRAPLSMDTMPVTGQVMTYALNALITDSSPGMSSYVTGTKGANNQTGVFPDDTADPFDNPRIEYFGEMLRRTRGSGFNVGIVTTADVTDSTPAGNAVHTGDRGAGPGIAAQFFDERATNGVSVLMGGGARHFLPQGVGSTRKDDRDLLREFETAGYARITTATDMRALLAQPKLPPYILGLFNPAHMTVAFDKVGAGRYSDELAQEKNAPLRDQPMLDDMARLALRALAEHSPRGFYLMVEGASIDKRAHDTDAERMIWDAIEFDHAVGVALEFARRTNTDRDPDNDTLVIVTADHECGGLGIVGVGNERYAPSKLGKAVRDYAAVFRFQPEDARLDLFPNYEVDAAGFPVDPDPSRKLLLGWAAGPDRYENWLANRRQLAGATRRDGVAVANPERDGPGDKIPGFPVSGVIENGANACTPEQGCIADTSSVGHTIAGHTATDIPLSAEGPGAYQFTGTYNNTDVMLKLLRATTGAYADPLGRPAQRGGAAATASRKAGSGSK